MSGSGLSVTALSLLIQDSLKREPRLRDVTVTGEISGFKHHIASGHWYFSLKDAVSTISAVMFRQNNLRAAVFPTDGMLVTVNGYVDFYSRDGRTQLYITALQPAGIGTLYEQFEALKQRLSAEGIFDPSKKKLLPLIPRKVAIITSVSGAALYDMLNVSGMRSPGIPIVVVPSSVQGAEAGNELVRAVKKASSIPQVDVIILGRGGGSIEDLWCFNDENLARVIAACPIPVVSGVGHETDWTICDMAADVRASTPSNAAEIVFPSRAELKHRVQLMRTLLTGAETGRVYHARNLIALEKKRLAGVSPVYWLQRVREASQRNRGILARIMRERIEKFRMYTSESRTGLMLAENRRIQLKHLSLFELRASLEAINPLKVLERGYALVYDEEGKIVSSAKSARRLRKMQIQFSDGIIEAAREEIYQE